ncbi:uncharacterized protein LOC143886216 [Tasmannia lanceolata]|uniref:uncharacterized protein LOC143886216 n=1 Tax=Tasmannia lanceolata TaxID=3420 RepID=UPI00406320C0
MESWKIGCFLLVIVAFSGLTFSSEQDSDDYISALGDPGMRIDSLRVAIESWNFCNEVGEEATFMGSPRAADCFNVHKVSSYIGDRPCFFCKWLKYLLIHKIIEKDNKLGVGDSFPEVTPQALSNVDLYAAEKELYLGSKCQVNDDPNPWQFWKIMLKNGNMDTHSGLCPENGKKVGPFPQENRFPCFGKGCMNQPLVFHNYTNLEGRNKTTLKGSFYGTYDLDADLSKGFDEDTSYFSVTWEKEVGKGSWVFHHVLRTSTKYPWLMLYLRSDATQGLSGGYHYETRGMTTIIPESPNFKVKFSLNVMKGGGPKTQFYLIDMASCWKNNGESCDGNVTTDVTRYTKMIINPNITGLCKPESINFCPPYHTFSSGIRIHRNDTLNYPYGAYHMYCSPGNAEYLEEPYNLCDEYSNPQAQETLQILPHPLWAEYGYPTTPGEGWIGNPRSWELDVGRMSQTLYFYQDPDTPSARRQWPSLNVGAEINVGPGEVTEWTLSDFDIIIPDQGVKY